MATVDILMATYNGEKYVREQVESIQKQSFTDWRLLVSDDCSTDATIDIIQSLMNKDKRIKIVSRGIRHGSAKSNFMNLLTKSDAPYVMFCDQDDVWLPNKIEMTYFGMKGMEQDKEDVPLLVFTDMEVVDRELNTLHCSFERMSNINPHRTTLSQLLAQSVGAGCTMMINRTAVKYALKQKCYEGIVMHDWWLSLICSAFGHILFINKPTSLYRQHGENEVGASNYSPFARVFQFEEMRKSVLSTIQQAIAFRETYRNEMTINQIRIINEFEAAGKTSGFYAMLHLVKSRCWKKGFRKLGQLIVFLSGLGYETR